jgi:hypothetical protein
VLTGQRPFVADSIEALVQKILNEDPVRRASCARADCPKRSIAQVLRAMKKKAGVPLRELGGLRARALEGEPARARVRRDSDSEKYVALKKVEVLSHLSGRRALGDGARRPLVARAEGKDHRQGRRAGKDAVFLARGEVKVTKGGRLLNLVNPVEYFGEMAYMWGGALPRHATVER